jgi:hypothetical protein
MKAEMQTMPKNFIAPALLAVLAGLVVAAVALRVELPVLSNAKAAFVTLAAIGVGICFTGGMGYTYNRRAGWWHPLNLLGYLLGLLALGLIVLVFLGIPAPLAANDRQAILTLAAIIFIKVGLKLYYRLALQERS